MGGVTAANGGTAVLTLSSNSASATGLTVSGFAKTSDFTGTTENQGVLVGSGVTAASLAADAVNGVNTQTITVSDGGVPSTATAAITAGDSAFDIAASLNAMANIGGASRLTATADTNTATLDLTNIDATINVGDTVTFDLTHNGGTNAVSFTHDGTSIAAQMGVAIEANDGTDGTVANATGNTSLTLTNAAGHNIGLENFNVVDNATGSMSITAGQAANSLGDGISFNLNFGDAGVQAIAFTGTGTVAGDLDAIGLDIDAIAGAVLTGGGVDTVGGTATITNGANSATYTRTATGFDITTTGGTTADVDTYANGAADATTGLTFTPNTGSAVLTAGTVNTGATAGGIQATTDTGLSFTVDGTTVHDADNIAATDNDAFVKIGTVGYTVDAGYTIESSVAVGAASIFSTAANTVVNTAATLTIDTVDNADIAAGVEGVFSSLANDASTVTYEKVNEVDFTIAGVVHTNVSLTGVQTTATNVADTLFAGMNVGALATANIAATHTNGTGTIAFAASTDAATDALDFTAGNSADGDDSFDISFAGSTSTGDSTFTFNAESENFTANAATMGFGAATITSNSATDSAMQMSTVSIEMDAGATIASSVDGNNTNTGGIFNTDAGQNATIVAAGNTDVTAGNRIAAQIITINGESSANVDIGAQATAREIVSLVNAVSDTTGVEATAKTTATLDNLSADGTISFSLYGTNSGTGSGQIISAAVTANDMSSLVTAINDQSGKTGITAQAETNNPSRIVLTHSTGSDIKIEDFEHTAAITDTTGATDATVTINVTGNSGLSAQLTDGGLLAEAGQSDSTVIGAEVTFKSDSSTFNVSSNIAATAGGLFAGGVNQAQSSLLTSVSSLDISSVGGANEAIDVVDGALARIDSIRGDLGAVQNRFESTVAALNTTVENASGARSRILDTDFASETANLTRSQILQQAGVAMLSQANSLPQLVLSLLQ